MERKSSTPREGWENTIQTQGMIYSEAEKADGTTTHYWNENAYYSFTDEEISTLEKATQEIHDMALDTMEFLVEEQHKDNSPWHNLNLPEHAVQLAIDSFHNNDKSLYGRMDLAYNGEGTPKLLEYNADTPTGLIESSPVQLFWLDDVHPDKDQFNSVHDMLLDRWKELMDYYESSVLYFTHSGLDESGEELMNTAYLRDTAMQAGWKTNAIEISDIGLYDNKFYDLDDNEITTMFKLYPWEDLMIEDFGESIAEIQPAWIEPAYKMFLSNKALLAAMYHLYPDNDYLLPTYLEHPHGMTDYVKKPFFGREGSNIEIVRDGKSALVTSGSYGEDEFIYQKYTPLADFPREDHEHNHVVIGSWVIGDDPAGIIVRESDGLVTDFYSRVCPHIIE